MTSLFLSLSFSLSLSVDTAMVLSHILIDFPQQTTCQRCNQQVLTSPQHVRGCYAWFMCVFIFIFGGFLGCFLIPLYAKGFRDVHHMCPSCQEVLFVRKRF
uniref:LITAF domain-containing protein n=1 Tax=Erpetoichthys calabaricus TaxID=27687 RepID=A0A8C4SPQ6_ERPCA